jgi:hypothetical protein
MQSTDEACYRRLWPNVHASFVACVIAISSTVVWAEEVTLSDLEGMMVVSSVMHQQVLRQKGKENSSRLQVDANLFIGSAGEARLMSTLSAYGKRTHRAKPTVQNYKLDQPVQVGTVGGGHALLTFQNGTLTLLRVYKTGAAKREYLFKREAAGVSCTVSESFVREVGARGIVLESPFGLGPTTIINDKQLSSNCKVMSK